MNNPEFKSGFKQHLNILNLNSTDESPSFSIDSVDGDKLIDLIEYASTTAKKDLTKSAEYRRLGNQAVDEDHLDDASYLYTLAILYAPCNQVQTLLL